jgi:hypothetical protein
MHVTLYATVAEFTSEEFLVFLTKNTAVLEQMWTIAEEQVVPTLEQLVNTAQSGLCHLAIATATDLSSDLHAKLELLAAAAPRQLRQPQPLNLNSLKERGSALTVSLRHWAKNAFGKNTLIT